MAIISQDAIKLGCSGGMAKPTTKLLYNCRESSTNRPYFMQNKANFRKSQMDISLIITRDYEKNIALDTW